MKKKIEGIQVKRFHILVIWPPCNKLYTKNIFDKEGEQSIGTTEDISKEKRKPLEGIYHEITTVLKTTKDAVL